MAENSEYKVLYRSFRPYTFEGVIGQKHITDILKSQVAHETVAHAYLFCGPRGTGKTSTAKIFARAICCKSPIDGDACGKCDVCLSSDLEDVDIVEIDAASNNGVDEIRNLREKVRLSPVYSAKKVYIIDEVHMLSQGAFNALLKTLEEPPAHVVFILATTEPQKLPATIISRCQRFDFHRVSMDDIAFRLKYICEKINADFDGEALYIIARRAEGGFRDALSLLDQCIAAGKGITAQNVLQVLGDVPFDLLQSFSKAVIESDTENVLRTIDEVVDLGLDLEIFLSDIIAHMRNILIAKMVKDPSGIIKEQGEQLKSIIEISKLTNENRLIRTLEALNEAQNGIKYAASPRIVIEVAVLKASLPESQNDYSAILDRLDTIENKISKIEKDGVVLTQTAPRETKEKKAETNSVKVQSAEKEVEIVKEKPKMNLAQNASSKGKETFSKILEELEKDDIVLYTTASEGKFVSDDANMLTIAFDDEIFISALKAEPRFSQLKSIVKKIGGYDNIDIISTNDIFKKPQTKETDVLEMAFELFGKENVDIIDD